MDTSQHDLSHGRGSDEHESEFDLYTIPIHSSWFSWDEIHETEKSALKEFFDGSSISRTPRIYKEYRDFIINKYREDPSGRLTFTEVRKSLVGDVHLLHKVFLFLERWGLINFLAPLDGNNLSEVEDGESSKIKIEDGVPNGIRVGAMPNSVKPISAPPTVEDNVIVHVNGVKLPPLTSYSDVFGDLLKPKNFVCGTCGDHCGSGYYQCDKDGYLICINCFKNGNYGEQRHLDDFKFNECKEDDCKSGATWTEAETLLLLESVLKHGDDWELVAQNVQTKTKLDCILKLVELPFGFGESLLFSEAQLNDASGSNNNASSEKEIIISPSNSQEIGRTEDQRTEDTNEDKDAENPGPSKRQCVASVSDPSNSFLTRVASISSMVGPHVMAAAAASVTALFDENLSSEEIFDGEDVLVTNGSCSTASKHEAERVLDDEDLVSKERSTQTVGDKDDMPLTVRMRAAFATALGAAAAHAKLLADQEERGMEYLLAMIIETQMKKVQRKIKHFEDVEVIMEAEYGVMEEVEERVLRERLNVLQCAFNVGVSKWKDHPSFPSLL